MSEAAACSFCSHPISATAGPERASGGIRWGFCGNCGVHLERGSQARLHAYAANPHQHVLRPHVISTLFPHVTPQHSRWFLTAVLLVTAGLIVCGLLRLTGPSVVLASTGIPLLYLLYLWEVEVYENGPMLAIGLTAVLGAVLGVVWSNGTAGMVTQANLLNLLPAGVDTGAGLRAAVLVPLGALVLMLAGPVMLYLTRRHDEALDGFTFGAAAALGFVFGTALVDLLPEIQNGLVAPAQPGHYVLRALRWGLFIPFIYAISAGLVGGSLWLHGGRRRRVPYGWTASLWSTVPLAAAAQAALGLIGVYVVSQTAVTALTVAIAAVLLFWVRLAIHAMLLAEAVESPQGGDVVCFHCAQTVTRSAFCPSCGVATRATPKYGTGRLGREVR